jgi:hypothetical protein
VVVTQTVSLLPQRVAPGCPQKPPAQAPMGRPGRESRLPTVRLSFHRCPCRYNTDPTCQPSLNPQDSEPLNGR